MKDILKRVIGKKELKRLLAVSLAAAMMTTMVPETLLYVQAEELQELQESGTPAASEVSLEEESGSVYEPSEEESGSVQEPSGEEGGSVQEPAEEESGSVQEPSGEESDSAYEPSEEETESVTEASVLSAVSEDVNLTSDTIDMNTVFPDEVFRSYVLKRLGKTEEDTVTEADLEKITSISLSGSDDAQVKSLEGIERLSNLTSLNVERYEDASQLFKKADGQSVSFGELKRWTYFYVYESGLTEMPDLSGSNVTHVNLGYNKISITLEDALKKMPQNQEVWGDILEDLFCYQYTSPQELVLADSYYFQGSTVPFAVMGKNV